MPILIQPILIDGTKYCLTQGWRTQSFLSGSYASLNTTEGDNSWKLVQIDGPGGAGITGGVKFGVICVEEINLEIFCDRDHPDEVATVTIKVNGAEVADSPLIFSGPANPGVFETLDITGLTPSPCGNIIEISVVQDSFFSIDNVSTRVTVTGHS